MAFLLKRWDGQDIAKKRYCPVQPNVCEPVSAQDSKCSLARHDQQ
jgi:hypothetical protein